MTLLWGLFLSSPFVHGVLGQVWELSNGPSFAIKMAQVPRSSVIYLHFVHLYFIITIYILFIFILIKCNFQICSDISRSEGPVTQLATFKVCYRSNQCDQPPILAAYLAK